MANKKISELDSRASLSLSDLLAVGDPTTGYLYKITITDLKSLTGAGVVSFNGRVGAVSPAEGDYTLTQLGDVIITSPSNGQYLQYNGSNWVNATLDLSGYVTLAGSQTITGTKTFAPAHSNGVNAFVAGGFAASQVKATYGANVNDMTFSVGDGFSVVRIGTTAPAMYAALGLNFYGANLSVYGTYNGTANPPGEIRLAGNYGFGTAAIGAYNTAVSTLTIGNSYNSYQYNQIVYARNMVWMHNDASTQPTYSAAAIMNLQSTTKGFVMPRMTTAQRDAIASPIAGLEIYNSSTNKPNYYNGSTWLEPGAISSITFTAPTGFSVSGSPLTSSGTIGLSFAAGYSLPTSVKQSNWDDAYTFVAAFPSQTGNSGKYLTTDGSALSWATVSSYSLPIATASVLGGVKIGSGVSIDAGGVISVSTNYQAPLNGTGFVKASGTTISYDNSTYLTTASAASTYLALSGGTLTGALAGTSATFSGIINANAQAGTANGSINIESSDPTLRFRVTGGSANKRIYEWRAIAAGGAYDYLQLRIWNDAQSSSTELLKIASTGSVWFSPSGSNDDNQIRISNPSTSYKDLQWRNSDNNKMWIWSKRVASDGDHFAAWYYNGTTYNSAPNLYLKTDGTTLLGTTSGISGGGTLQVNGNVNINGVFQINGTTIGGGGGAGVTGSGTNGYITKWTGASTLGNSAIYESGNYIGIGTTSTTGRVTIAPPNNSTTSSIEFTNSDNAAITAYYSLTFGVDNSNTVGGRIIQFGKGGKGYGNLTAISMLINADNGFVGVGTTSPNRQFVVSNAGTQGLEIANHSGYSSILTYNRSTNAYTNLYLAEGTSNVIIGGAYADNGYKLQVNGAMSMAYGYIFKLTGSTSDILIANTGSTMSITGSMSVSSSVTASAFYESSDIRFKNVLATNPEVNVSGIDVIKFTRKTDSQIRYGYSAQQVQSILPDVVVGENELVVNYIDVHTLKIAALEKEVAELKAKLN